MKVPVHKAPPAAAIVMPTWNGFYLGGHGGCGWSSTPAPTNYAVDVAENLGVFTTADQASGCFGGGQIGFNYQLPNNVVVGIEADASFGSIGSSFVWNQFAGAAPDDTNSWTSRLQSFGTIRGRLGYSFGQLLPYVTGGWAWGRNRLTSMCPISCDSFGDPATSSDTQFHSGWVLGAGFEYAIARNWSIKAEYLHLDLGSSRYNVQVDFDDGVPPGADFGILRFDTVKLGVNYQLGGGPLAMKY